MSRHERRRIAGERGRCIRGSRRVLSASVEIKEGRSVRSKPQRKLGKTAAFQVNGWGNFSK